MSGSKDSKVKGSDKGQKYYKNKLKLLAGWIQSQLGSELPSGLISSDDSDDDQVPLVQPNVNKKKVPAVVNKQSLIDECLTRRYIVRLERLSLTSGFNDSSTKTKILLQNSDGGNLDDQVQVKEEQNEEDFLNNLGFDDNYSRSDFDGFSTTNEDFLPDSDTNNTRIFKCPFDPCPKRFSNSKDLVVHERLHTRPRPWKCKLCPSKAYYTKHKLNRHNLNFHLDNRPELCEICQKRFRDKTQLRVHMYSHSDLRRFKCSYEKCRKAFKTHGALSHHKKTHEPKSIYKCAKCSKVFPTASTLARHVNTTVHRRNRTKKEYDSLPSISEPKSIDQETGKVDEKLKCICYKCNKGFPNNYKLQRHLISCLQIPVEKNDICDICGKAFADKPQLKRHLVSHSTEKPFEYECDEDGCTKKFKALVNLKVHKKAIHYGQREYEQCDICGVTVSKEHLSSHIRNQHTEGLERFPCDVENCTKIFKFKNRLSMHKEIIHLIRDPDSRRNWLNMDRIFKCDREGCDKAFKYKARLKVHKRTHEKADIKGFNAHAPAFLSISCEVCKSFFSNKAALRYHMKKYHQPGAAQPEKKYLCSVCPKQLLSAGALTIHLKIHTGEKPLECEYCFKKFLHATHLKNHRSSSHTKELQQICSICGIVLSNPVSLKQHMGAIHSEETPHKCHKCDKAFKIKPYLQAHLKVHEDNEKIARGEVVIRKKKKKKSKNKTNAQY